MKKGSMAEEILRLQELLGERNAHIEELTQKLDSAIEGRKTAERNAEFYERSYRAECSSRVLLERTIGDHSARAERAESRLEGERQGRIEAEAKWHRALGVIEGMKGLGPFELAPLRYEHKS